MSMHLEEIRLETLYIAHALINSNQEYNKLENGLGSRTFSEIEVELLNEKTTSAFIKLDDTYIGVIDYMLENPKDHVPWLGLLMIHSDYQGFGYGAQAYALYENEMQKRGLNKIRIGVLKENSKSHHFWENLGFKHYTTTNTQNGSGILCYQKQID